MYSILIIDDDDAIRRTLELHLGDQRYVVWSADSLATGRELWRQNDPDFVLLDLKLPDGEGTTLLNEMSSQSQAIVIMVTGHQNMDYAIRAMKEGAFNYIHKPLNLDELEAVLQRASDILRQRRRATLLADSADWLPGRFAGQSRAVLDVDKQIGMIAKSRVNVLLSGESGTGKELVARLIHKNTNDSDPFVAVNCSAIVPTLLESELFGHERGSFTGAHQRKIGKCELAAGGTLFLDEIGDLSLELQAVLLRVLQERTFERVGGNAMIPFEARVIAATNRDLTAMVRQGQFREDLFFRLNVMNIAIPPLRERREDIPVLVYYLLEKINRDLHRPITRVSDDVMKKLGAAAWPGNVRELENVLTQAVLRSTGDVLTLDFSWIAPLGVSTVPALRTIAEVEKEHIVTVLHAVQGNLGKACETLGITRPTLRKKIEDYGIVF